MRSPIFALHEIAQTIGSSLNLNDTVTLVSNKLSAIVPFDTCTIFVVDEKSGRAVAAHVAGEHADVFKDRRMNVGDGITGWVIANARSMCNASPELDLVGIPEEVARKFRGVLVSPLLREDGAFGAITLYSKSRTSYSTEHVRLLESVCQHASSALNNALTYEKTKDSALIDPLTDLPQKRTAADGHLDALRRRRICRDYADGIHEHGCFNWRTRKTCCRRAEVFGANRNRREVRDEPRCGLFPRGRRNNGRTPYLCRAQDAEQ